MARRITMDEKIPALSAANLKRGMREFLARGWPADFHAEFYGDLPDPRRGGFTAKWWDETVAVLSEWNTLRPYGGEFVRKRGRKHLGELSREYQRLLAREKKPDLESCDWRAVLGLFKIAHKIKGVPSPVFAAKLCHFISPPAFPVFDVAALELVNDPTEADYREYREVCRNRWRECGDKKALKQILLAKILRADKKAKTAKYPWPTKIAELCAIGRP
ncbi:MAG: hypothetical protein ACR2QC_03730 [Gammaproteobacteria bacterium]